MRSSPTFVLVSATSSEPDNGLGDGKTINDIQGVDGGSADTSFALRAERSGFGPGRVHSVESLASDASGNVAPSSSVVTVPHSP